MPQDTGKDFAAGPTVTLLSADLTDTNASALTATVDLGTPTPVAIGYQLIVTGLTGAVDLAFLEGAWSHDNSNFSDLSNLGVLAFIVCAASADAKKSELFEVQGRYVKFRIDNQSGGTIDGTASNTALVLTDMFYNQV